MKTWNRFLPASFAFVLLLFLASGSFAQAGRVNLYKVTTPTLTWNDISTTGTVVTPYKVSYYSTGPTMSLPIDFNYDNTVVSAGTTLYLNCGTLGFGNSASPNYVQHGGLASSSYPAHLVLFGAYYMCMGSGLGTMGSGTSGEGIWTQVTGSKPNRVWTLQIHNLHSPGADGYSWGVSAASDMQIKLFEGTNVIQFLYRSKNTASDYYYNYYSLADVGIGLNGFTTPSFQYLTATTGGANTPSTDLQFSPPLPPAQLSLQPKSLNYGGVGTGFSLTLSDTVYSVGAANLTVNSATIGGSGDYSLVGAPATPYVLTPGSKQVYNIKFTPTGSGSLTATFTVNTSGNDSGVQSCLLNGSGLTPNVVYTFPYNGLYPKNTLFHHVARRFGDSATAWFYVQNTGQVSMLINSIYFTGLQANMYSLIHVPPNPLGAGVLDSIGVRFKPFLEGRPDAQLVIGTNAINIPWDTVSMWGAGILAHLVITPSRGSGNTLAFDSVAIGDSVCQTLTLHNTGTDTLIINRQVITSGDFDFKFYPLVASDTILVPDASKLCNVCFTPLRQGARFASLRFYTNIPKTYPDNRDTSQFPINITGTGVPYGILTLSGSTAASALIDSTKCVSATIKNTGLSDLKVESATISGAGADDFKLSGVTIPFILAAGASMPVQLCFTASVRGPEQATLLVSGHSSGRALSQSVTLTGMGEIACLNAAPSPVTFGSTALPGMTLAGTGHDTTCITVTNCGDVPETFSAAFGPTTSGYRVLGGVVTPSVAPNATTTICVEYNPNAIGASNGSLIVSASEPSATPMTLSLLGVGAGVGVAASGAPLATKVGWCDTFTVTLTDTGNIPWTPGPGTISGQNSMDFTILGSVTPATIPAGQSGTVKIAYCPQAVGTSSASLSFNTSSPNPLDGMPYLLSGQANQGSGVAERTEQNGFALGASYPNPTNGKSDVIVTMPHAGQVTIVLTNLSGAAVRTIYTGTLNAGDNVVSLDAGDLASGTYFYMLTSGDVRLTREMILAR